MMVRRSMIPLVAIWSVVTCSAAVRADTKQVPVVRLHAETEVAAPPAAVWTYMTTGKNMVTMCPVWKSAKNAAVKVSKVGDVLDYTDEWGNNGRSVVTYMVKNKELRVAHEPNKGDYICQAKLVLTPTPNGTLVHYWEQYTDESSPTDMQ